MRTGFCALTGRGFSKYLLVAAVLIVTLNPSAARADDITLYYAQGVDENLRSIFPSLFRGGPTWDQTRFAGFGYYHEMPPPVFLKSHGIEHGIEGLAVKHFGLQDVGEFDAAYKLRSPDLTALKMFFKFGASGGLSYVTGRPSYEDGPSEGSDRRYRFLYYMAFEVETGAKRYDKISIVARIHHRSGIYGIIAPPLVGSNFIAFGLRFKLP